MLQAFSKGVSQLSDPKARSVLWLSIGVAVVVFAAIWLAVGYVVEETTFFQTGWLNTVVDILGWLTVAVLTWFLFPGVVATVIGLFLDRIADAVEARHYPELPAADGLAIGPSIVTAIRYLFVLVALNMVLLLFLVVPPVFPFVFYIVNGYLVSREYFELVALRRMSPEEARALRLANRGRLLFAGIVIVVLLTVPLVNLLAPVVATAAMVHLFEGWRRGSAA